MCGESKASEFLLVINSELRNGGPYNSFSIQIPWNTIIDSISLESLVMNVPAATKNVNVNIREIPGKVKIAGGNLESTFRVASPGTTVHWERAQGFDQVWHIGRVTPSIFNIEVKDDLGSLIALAADWSMVLKITTKD